MQVEGDPLSSNKELADGKAEKRKDVQGELICGTKGREKRSFVIAPIVQLRLDVMLFSRSSKIYIRSS